MQTRLSLKKSLSFKFVLVALVPVAIIGLITLNYLPRILTEQVSSKNLVLAKTLAGEVEQFLNEPLSLLEQINEVISSGLVEPEKINAYLDTVVKTYAYFDMVQFVSQGGVISNLAPFDPVLAGRSVAEQPFYRETKKSRRPYWSPTFISPRTGQPTLTISSTTDTTMVVGYLNLARLNTIIEKANYSPNCFALVVDQDGTTIACRNRNHMAERKNFKDMQVVQFGMMGLEGTYEDRCLDADVLASVAVVPQTGWPIVFIQEKHEAYAPLRKIQNIFRIGILITVAAAIALALRSLHKTLTPLSRLVDNLEKVTAGEYQFQEQEKSYPEINVLTEHFSIMTSAVKKREEQLRQSEERFRMLVETMTEGLNMTDENGTITYANRRFCEVTGYLSEEIVGRSLLDLVDDANQAIIAEQLRRRKEGGGGSYEITYTRKDGSRLPAIVSPQGIFDAKGRYQGAFAVITDITGLKKVEEALRESETKFRELSNLLPQPIFELDLAGNFTYTNQVGFEATGYTGQDFDRGLNVFQLLIPGEQEKVQKNIARVLAGENINPQE